MDMPVKPREELDLFVNARQQFERALTWIDDIKVGLIDYQDMLIGPDTYDGVSLLGERAILLRGSQPSPAGDWKEARRV